MYSKTLNQQSAKCVRSHNYLLTGCQLSGKTLFFFQAGILPVCPSYKQCDERFILSSAEEGSKGWAALAREHYKISEQTEHTIAYKPPHVPKQRQPGALTSQWSNESETGCLLTTAEQQPFSWCPQLDGQGRQSPALWRSGNRAGPLRCTQSQPNKKASLAQTPWYRRSTKEEVLKKKKGIEKKAGCQDHCFHALFQHF